VNRVVHTKTKSATQFVQGMSRLRGEREVEVVRVKHIEMVFANDIAQYLA
jgi:hypothetical protein